MSPYTFGKTFADHIQRNYEVKKQEELEGKRLVAQKELQEIQANTQLEVLNQQINANITAAKLLYEQGLEKTEKENAFTIKRDERDHQQDLERMYRQAQLEAEAEARKKELEPGKENGVPIVTPNSDNFIGIGGPGWDSETEKELMEKKLYSDPYWVPDPNSFLGSRQKKDKLKLTATDNLNIRAFNAMGAMGSLIKQIDAGGQFSSESLNNYFALNEYLNNKDIKAYIKETIENKDNFDSERTRTYYYNMFNSIYNRKRIKNKQLGIKEEETEPQE